MRNFFSRCAGQFFFIRAKKIPDRFDPVKWYPHGDHKLGSRQVHVGNHLGAGVLHLQNHDQVHNGNHLGAGVLHLRKHDEVHVGNHLGARVLHLQNHDHDLGAGVLRGVYSY